MLVVAGAVVVAGRVLAARRSAPAELAGGWEFPGGKREPDESSEAAVVRECLEELGVAVEVLVRLASVKNDDLELELWSARLIDGTARIRAEHDELRWLAASELDAVAWLPLDRELLPAVAALLG